MFQIICSSPNAGYTAAFSTGGDRIPDRALHCEVVDTTTSISLPESMPGKKYARLRVNGSAKPGPFKRRQTIHINVKSEYVTSKNIAIRLTGAEDAGATAVSHSEFFKDMKNGDRINMHNTFDRVSNAYSRGQDVSLVQSYGITTGGVITKKEEVKDEKKKGEKRTEWVDHKLQLVGGEETKRGEIVVDISHGTNIRSLKNRANGVDNNNFKEESAFRMGHEVNRHTALKEKLKKENKRKEQEYTKILERKNLVKLRALYKMMAVLCTEEIKAIAAGALVIPFVVVCSGFAGMSSSGVVGMNPCGAVGIDLDLHSNSDSNSDDETVYECQDSGSEDCDEYQCYDCRYFQELDNEDGEENSDDDKSEGGSNEDPDTGSCNDDTGAQSDGENPPMGTGRRSRKKLSLLPSSPH
ncbi:hypothetical protein BJ508DRAFT_312319 [Ascobolus immersus RN42]|uniref:Uncharacterized protein n=1 Tax=Ascobolus immersus RN42 TaxID=1160509 RepID=A0A3N4HQ51_ASCIM|nr:hypothetical protein BJ508DRAFT_312319 [Ascobolus immersus RN42]